MLTRNIKWYQCVFSSITRITLLYRFLGKAKAKPVKLGWIEIRSSCLDKFSTVNAPGAVQCQVKHRPHSWSQSLEWNPNFSHLSRETGRWEGLEGRILVGVCLAWAFQALVPPQTQEADDRDTPHSPVSPNFNNSNGSLLCARDCCTLRAWQMNCVWAVCQRVSQHPCEEATANFPYFTDGKMEAQVPPAWAWQS